MEQDLEQAVIDLIRKHLDDEDLGEITRETHFVDDLEIDSLDAVEMMMAAEEAFGVKIEEEDLPETVGGFVDLISEKIASMGKPS